MADIDPKSIQGLSGEEAGILLEKHGYNELPSSKQHSIFAIAFEVIKEPMFILLVACGSLYFMLGDIQEGIMLLGFVFVVMGITFYQERKTERALEALRDLSSPRALVVRNGRHKRIAGREVVPGDTIILSEGDRVPADGIVIWCSNLSADESLLTGESVPVRKVQGDIKAGPGKPGGDDNPYIFSGSMIVQGQGAAVISFTGAETEIGSIGKALRGVEQEDTHLQKEMNVLVKNVAIIGAILCVLVFVIYGFTRRDWTGGFLAGLTLAMAVLPEEFPVILTVFFALGAWRISKKRVLTRRVPVVEMLGSATVLCVDKTGTLTMNMMAISEMYTNGKFYPVVEGRQLDPCLDEITEYGILSCQKDPFDPMEKAFKRLEGLYAEDKKRIYETHEFIKEYPLSKKMLALSHVWKNREDGSCIIGCKGAPESVIELCHMDDAERKQTLEKVNEMAEHGLRVLGVAKAVFESGSLPDNQHDFKFHFLGLVGLADPVRPEVKGSIKECYDAGIRVVMITGDYPGTARAIAKEIGLTNGDRIITGPELDALGEDELKEAVKETNIFARVVPEQKLKLVNAFKANGEVTAMTGDGVNDAPALKAANIGIAMGGRGTDVAREASSLVLLDDDFTSIVQAVKTGRRIFDNIKKALCYTVSVHVPIAGLSLLPVFFKWPLILMPVHIVFLELIIDPACSIVFEAEPAEKDVMKRKPRGSNTKVFGKNSILISLTQGFIVLCMVMAVYLLTGQLHASEGEARAMAFATLVISNLCLILTNLSWSRSFFSVLKDPNPAMWFIISGAIGLLMAVLYVPFLRELFKFGFLHLNDMLICFTAGFVSILWFELAKIFLSGRISK
jgi:Ca2+-transporting ATPase